MSRFQNAIRKIILKNQQSNQEWFEGLLFHGKENCDAFDEERFKEAQRQLGANLRMDAQIQKWFSRQWGVREWDKPCQDYLKQYIQYLEGLLSPINDDIEDGDRRLQLWSERHGDDRGDTNYLDKERLLIKQDKAKAVKKASIINQNIEYIKELQEGFACSVAYKAELEAASAQNIECNRPLFSARRPKH